MILSLTYITEHLIDQIHFQISFFVVTNLAIVQMNVR